MMSPRRSRDFLLMSAGLWLLGIVFLVLALSTRASSGRNEDFILWVGWHKAARVLAFLSQAAAAWSLRRVAASTGGIVGNGTAWLGTICGITSALALTLVFLTGASDMLTCFRRAASVSG
jgi:hypothetical protein